MSIAATKYSSLKTPADLDALPTSVIVNIYNTCTGKTIKGFHTRSKGLIQTWTALKDSRGDAAQVAEKTPAEKTKKVTVAADKREPLPAVVQDEDGNLIQIDQFPKCSHPRGIERHGKHIGHTVHKLGEHPGKGFRIRRWANYREGMTLAFIIRHTDYDLKDIRYYQKHDMMEVRDADGNVVPRPVGTRRISK